MQFFRECLKNFSFRVCKDTCFITENNLNTRFGAAPPMLFVNTGLIEFQAISRHGLRKDIKTEENREGNKRKGRL